MRYGMRHCELVLIIVVAIAIASITLGGESTKTLPASPLITVQEFDAAQCVSEGRLRITPTDRRVQDRPPLKLTLPITKGMPSGTKLVRLFFNDASQSWCCVVTHPSYLKVSPAGVVPVMTLILKGGE